MSKRSRYEAAPTKGGSGWDVKKDGNKVSHHNKKEPAVDKAREQAKKDPGNAQVIIKKQDGTIQEERTFPRSSDPKKTPG